MGVMPCIRGEQKKYIIIIRRQHNLEGNFGLSFFTNTCCCKSVWFVQQVDNKCVVNMCTQYVEEVLLWISLVWSDVIALLFWCDTHKKSVYYRLTIKCHHKWNNTAGDTNEKSGEIQKFVIALSSFVCSNIILFLIMWGMLIGLF